MSTGIDLMRKVRLQKATVRREYERETGLLRSTQDAVDRTRTELYRTLEDLSRLQVISLAEGDLDIWFSARQSMEEALRFRDGRYAAILEHIEGAQEGIPDREAAVEKAENDLVAAEQKLRDVEAQMNKAIEASSAVQEARKALRSSRLMATRAKEKADAAAAERDAKVQPYLTDPVFSYLVGIGFGKPEYAGIGFARLADQALAKLCRFSEARSNFNVLTQLPEFLGQHAVRMAQAVQEPQTKLDAALAKLEVEHEIGGVRQTVQAARDRLQRSVERLEALNRRITDLINEKESYGRWTDPAFEAAKKSMRQILEKASIADLEALAKATESTQDDALVARVASLRKRLSAAEAELKEVAEAVDLRRLQCQRVDDLENRSRRKGWDSSNYTVRSSGVDDLLTGYTIGTLTSSDAWDRLERSVTHTPPSSPSYRSRDDDGSSGSIGGGGWNTSSSIGGGGWSTTDLV